MVYLFQASPSLYHICRLHRGNIVSSKKEERWSVSLLQRAMQLQPATLHIEYLRH